MGAFTRITFLVIAVTLCGQAEAIAQETARQLLKAHGILMVFGWFVFVVPAIFFAAYFKPMWPGRRPFKLDLWFHFHRTLNLTGVLLILAAFICVFVASDGKWTGPLQSALGTSLNSHDLHCVLGMVASILAFLQPILALFRCKPGTSKRPIFNWIHRIIGVAAWAIAATTISFATNFVGWLQRDGIAPKALLYFFYAMVILKVFEFEFLICITDKLFRRPPTHPAEPNGVALGPLGPDGKPCGPSHGRCAQPLPPAPKWGMARVGLMAVLVTSGLIVAIGFAIMIGK